MPNLFGDLTEEELRLQNEAFGDFEFEAETSSFMGPFGEPEIQADRAVPVLNPENLTVIETNSAGHESYKKGFTAPIGRRRIAQNEFTEGRTDTLDEDVESFRGIFELGGIDPEVELKRSLSSEEPTIYTIGSEGNQGPTAAHEFRHVAFDVLRNMDPDSLDTDKKNRALKYTQNNIPRSGNQEEAFNRQFDAYRDTRGEALITLALNANEAETGRYDDIRAFPKKDRDKLLKTAVSQIKKNAHKFASLEAAASDMKGLPSPKGSSWKELYFKQFLGRLSIAESQAKKWLNRER